MYSFCRVVKIAFWLGHETSLPHHMQIDENMWRWSLAAIRAGSYDGTEYCSLQRGFQNCLAKQSISVYLPTIMSRLSTATALFTKQVTEKHIDFNRHHFHYLKTVSFKAVFITKACILPCWPSLTSQLFKETWQP